MDPIAKFPKQIKELLPLLPGKNAARLAGNNRQLAWALASGRKYLGIAVFLVISLRLALTAPAVVFESPLFDSFNGQSSLAIPDGSPVGVSDAREISTSEHSLLSVSVTLNLSSSFNGDLYVYLRHGDQLAVLLNRPGRTEADPFGYSDEGFKITLSDALSGNDIHSYRSVTTPLSGEPVTGLWQSDGRLSDPDLVLANNSRTASLNGFNGLDPNGTWTLYLADLNRGASSSLESWKLEISTVPECSQACLALALPLMTWALVLKVRKTGRSTIHP